EVRDLAALAVCQRVLEHAVGREVAVYVIPRPVAVWRTGWNTRDRIARGVHAVAAAGGFEVLADRDLHRRLAVSRNVPRDAAARRDVLEAGHLIRTAVRLCERDTDR